MRKRNKTASIGGTAITVGIVITLFVVIPIMLLTRKSCKGLARFINCKMLKREGDYNE